MDHKNTPNSDLVAKRFLTQEPAKIEVYGRRGVIYARMSNLSATGAFFEIMSSAYTPRMGDLVCVTVDLKEVNKIHVLNGEVVWAKNIGLGVAFIKQKDLIKRLTG